eukprot:30020-Pelagococcus_subviridis.AAC.3
MGTSVEIERARAVDVAKDHRRRARVRVEVVDDLDLHHLLSEGRGWVHAKRRRGRWSSKASGVELKGVAVCASELKPRGGGRRDAPGSKVLKERRAPRRRGRMGTSVILERALSSPGRSRRGCSRLATGRRRRRARSERRTCTRRARPR